MPRLSGRKQSCTDVITELKDGRVGAWRKKESLKQIYTCVLFELSNVDTAQRKREGMSSSAERGQFKSEA